MPMDLKIKFISKLEYNLEIVKRRIKNKDIESWYLDVRKKTKLRAYVNMLHLKMNLMLSHIY